MITPVEYVKNYLNLVLSDDSNYDKIKEILATQVKNCGLFSN